MGSAAIPHTTSPPYLGFLATISEENITTKDIAKIDYIIFLQCFILLLKFMKKLNWEHSRLTIAI